MLSFTNEYTEYVIHHWMASFQLHQLLLISCINSIYGRIKWALKDTYKNTMTGEVKIHHHLLDSDSILQDSNIPMIFVLLLWLEFGIFFKEEVTFLHCLQLGTLFAVPETQHRTWSYCNNTHIQIIINDIIKEKNKVSFNVYPLCSSWKLEMTTAL